MSSMGHLSGNHCTKVGFGSTFTLEIPAIKAVRKRRIVRNILEAKSEGPLVTLQFSLPELIR